MANTTKRCKKCNEEIDSKAIKCKHCGADQRNWFARHKIITGFLILILLSVMFSSGADKGTNNSSNNSTNNDNNTVETKIYKVGDTVKVDGIDYKILAVKNLGNKIKGSWDTYTTQGTFIRVDFEVENTENDAKYMGSLNIVDSKEREFGETEDRYSMLGDNVEFLDNLNPNIKTKYSTVFDVAKDATELQLKISGYMFSIDEATISLGINASK